MQMADDAKPAEADSDKKKYGSFLADFEKQLWVDNWTEFRALQLQEEIHQPSWIFNQICAYLRKYCQKSRQGKEMHWKGDVRVCVAEPN